MFGGAFVVYANRGVGIEISWKHFVETISWKQRKEQSHAQCHVTHRIRIFDKISEHVKVAKSVDIAVPELAVTKYEVD